MKNKLLINCLIPVLLLFACATVFAQETPTTNSEFYTVDGAKLYYQVAGEGEPLFLLHHFGSTGTNGWSDYIDEFAKTYQVIVPDLRGHGKSEDPNSATPWEIEEVADDFIALLDHLKLDKVSAIGGSGGATVVLNAAVRAPSRFKSIVIVGGSAYRGNVFREWIRNNAEEKVTEEEIVLHGEKKAIELARQFVEFAEQIGDHELTPDRLSMITANTMIVNGDNDFLIPVKMAFDLYSAIPNASFWIVPNGGHIPYLHPENVVDFTTRMLEFLSKK